MVVDPSVGDRLGRELPLPRADLEHVEVGRRSGLDLDEVRAHLRQSRTSAATAARAALPSRASSALLPSDLDLEIGRGIFTHLSISMHFQ